MADSDLVTLARITYYCRESYYRHMQNAAMESLKKYGSDPVLLFFKGYSLILEDRLPEGIRELEVIKDKRDVNLCSSMALMYAHRRSRNIDKEAVQQLDAKIKEERKSAGEKGLYFAGLFLWHSGKHDKAREYVDHMLKKAPSAKDGLILKGWIDMTCGREAYAKKSLKYFDESMEDGSKPVDALLGKAKYLEQRRNYTGALDLLNQAVVLYPGFLPALIEKMRLQLCLQDWEQTMETAQRILAQDQHCLEAIRTQITFQLCREGNYEEANEKLTLLIQELDRFEPKNPALYCDMAKGFSRLCGRNMLILQQTFTLVERALSLDNSQADYATEAGSQLLLQGKSRDAIRWFRNAMKLDETSVSALTGVIKCQLLDGLLEDAEQQLEFLNEIQQSMGKSPNLLYLTALLARKRGKGVEEVTSLLNDCTEIHFGSLKGVPLSILYFQQLDPDFLIEVVNEYLLFAPPEPQLPGQSQPPLLKRCAQLLEPLTKAVPGLMEALYLLARAKFLSGDVDAARTTLQHCLAINPQFSDAHLLMAQIHLHEGNFQQSSQSLEMGLSYNFQVREFPIYHLIKARTHKKAGELQECVKTLQTAMALPGVKKAAQPGTKSKAAQISINDRVSVYLELTEAHRLLDEQHEAAKVMQDAINEFQGSSEEVRITIANADLALSRGDVELALTMLRNVSTELSYYVQAREKMANIYLNHRKDKRLYASCYRELVEKRPTPHTRLLLGDAYMAIQEPEKAIEVYESALKSNPRDSTLATKIGVALVKTHNYGKAINYYEAALKTGHQNFLRHDLAELLLKLRQYEKAERIIKAALENCSDSSDLASMMDEAKYLVVLSKAYHKSGKMDDSMMALTTAREVQAKVLKRVQVEQPDVVTSQKAFATSICCQMAEHARDQREYEKAIKFYKEALIYQEKDVKVMLELAGLYLTQNDLDACQHLLVTLLQIEDNSNAATVMMADLQFRKGDYEQATFHFQQLLTRTPDHYGALERVVSLMRRAGQLDQVQKFLDQAQQSSARAPQEPGFNYCRGLYQRYLGNANEALIHFNVARKDSEWGQRALENMIEICLNPDNQTLGGETFENVDSSDVSAEKQDSDQAAVRTAEKLLKELKPKPGSVKHLILENYTLMASKAKGSYDKALSAFMDIATNERDHVPALLGMATAYMLLKQTPRARNQLKRIAKMNWNSVDAEEFEKSWLLLADIYIQSAKYDMATELLKKCIQHNKSCSKAYEYSGFIMEKEQSYKDAAENYEKAWIFSNHSNATIGYKLAFNYLKAKRFVDAIDVCHEVLTSSPNYPKIRKDILDKARSLIRT